MTDRRAAEILYPDQGKSWRIELKYKTIAHRGHAYLALVDGDDKLVRELHGLGISKNTGKPMMMAGDGADLRGRDYEARLDGKPILSGKNISIGTVTSGTREEIERKWAQGVEAMNAIDAMEFDYKSHDPTYELGTDGGEIQNSNSYIYTVGKAQGFDLDRVIENAKINPRVLSGWGRDLLDPKYQRYVAPPTFPVRDAP